MSVIERCWIATQAGFFGPVLVTEEAVADDYLLNGWRLKEMVPAERLQGAVKALERYGRHDNDCDIHPGMPGRGACDCGFDAALPSPSSDLTKEDR